MGLRTTLGILGAFAGGMALGGYLFAHTQPRRFLEMGDCAGSCYRSAELAGFITSVTVQRAPFLLPRRVAESDTCVAIEHPKPMARWHVVLFPKTDIKNIASIAEGDERYVMGCLAMARSLTQSRNLQSYRLFTNGPGKQDIAYLHFHLISDQAPR
jgi:hypothetical protein